jgi:hypothetical protein
MEERRSTVVGRLYTKREGPKKPEIVSEAPADRVGRSNRATGRRREAAAGAGTT